MTKHDAIRKLENYKFEVDEFKSVIFAKHGIGTLGTGKAIDFLLNYNGFFLSPFSSPRKNYGRR